MAKKSIEAYSASRERAYKTFLEFGCDQKALLQAATTLRRQLEDGSIFKNYGVMDEKVHDEIASDTQQRIADLEAAGQLKTPQFPAAN